MLSIETCFKGYPCFYAYDQNEWQQWLEKNHQTQKSVWLIIYKVTSDVKSIKFGEALDTAICYGWIDSKKHKRDEHSYYSYYSPRSPKSNWSRINKQKISKLEAEGRLTDAAYEMIALAKSTSTWTALNDVENLVIPDDLKEVFNQYDHSIKNWEQFPRNIKRSHLEWILNAKRPATRKKRINLIASMAEENKKANQ